MATKHLSAQLSRRDIWYAAAELEMRDATEQEVTKVCFLINACGKTPEEAKAIVEGLRKRPDTTKEKTIFGVKLPEEWFHDMSEDLTGLSNSELLRYALARIIDGTHEDALQNAKRTRGRPRKS
jgi:hypothetical protein